jgi:hypothetical protein
MLIKKMERAQIFDSSVTYLKMRDDGGACCHSLSISLLPGLPSPLLLEIHMAAKQMHDDNIVTLLSTAVSSQIHIGIVIHGFFGTVNQRSQKSPERNRPGLKFPMCDLPANPAADQTSQADESSP